MQSQEEITAAHWLKETQKGYIRVAVLILLGKKPYARARNVTRHNCICVRTLEALAVMRINHKRDKPVSTRYCLARNAEVHVLGPTPALSNALRGLNRRRMVKSPVNPTLFLFASPP
jgi:hypothetical protein